MKPSDILETVAIIFAILSLWPVVLHWDHWFWKVFMYAMLAAMVWVFVRRVRRYAGAAREQQDRIDSDGRA